MHTVITDAQFGAARRAKSPVIKKDTWAEQIAAAPREEAIPKQ
jgi:hypothetical protein